LSVCVYRDRADLPSVEHLAEALGIPDRATRKITESDTRFDVMLAPGDSLGGLIPHVIDAMDDDQQTVVEPFPEGWALSELASYMAAAHALSTLVRYHATRWARL